MVVDFGCGIDRDAAETYIDMETYNRNAADTTEITQNFYDCLQFVASPECCDCENKCDLYKKVRGDLDNLYANNPDEYYERMTDVILAFKGAIELKQI